MSKSKCGACVNPYSREHYAKLVDAERALSDLIPLIDKVENCGAECQVFREVAESLQQRFSALKKEFMTPPPK